MVSEETRTENKDTSFGFESVPVHRPVVGVTGDVGSFCVSTANQTLSKSPIKLYNSSFYTCTGQLLNTWTWSKKESGVLIFKKSL